MFLTPRDLDGSRGLPRLLRRGLIEASARASADHLNVDRLPRLLRRGLIEALATWNLEHLVARDFPGYFAGASLKPSRRSTVRRLYGHDFPGYFAGASLKPRRLGARVRTGVAGLPRLLRRGLIEATKRWLR